MKRILAFALALCLCVGLAACGGSSSSQPADVSAPAFEEAADAGPFVPTGPAPEINLVTGEALFGGLAEGDRPVAIMVHNAQSALPQRGVGSADAIFEMVTEGGITRLLALFSDKDAVPQTGPVRSARDQHLQFAMPMNALIVHIGSSIYAENLLSQYHYETIDGMYLGATSFWYDDARKASGYVHEFCWFTDAALIAAGIEKKALPVTGSSQPLFHFASDGDAPAVPGQGGAGEIAFSFSELCPVALHYDAAAGKYLKDAFGAPHVDELTGAQLAFDNVVVLFTDIRLKNPDDPNNSVTDFALSSGSGYYCYGGTFRAVTWRKGSPEEPLRLLDESGGEIAVNVGKSYIAVVGSDRAHTLLFDGAGPAGAEADAAADAAVPAAGEEGAPQEGGALEP